jgi:uncharacterized protein (TIGR02246 family)
MRHRFPFVFVALLGAALACRAADAPRAGDGDERAVRELLLDGARRFSAHDADGYLALYAPDADLVNVSGRRWRLPGDRGLVRAAFDGALREARMEPLEIEVRFPRPDVALARCTMVVGPFVEPDGRRRPPERQLALSVLTKEDGHWVVRAFQNTRAPEPPD